MKRKITKLIDVKSIVTLSFTLTFCIMALNGKINNDEFRSLFTVIISFYFGTQYEKGKGDKNE